MKKQQIGRPGRLTSVRTWFGGARHLPVQCKAGRRRPKLEPLEDRTLLAVNVSFPGIPTWQEIGPAPQTAGQVVLPGDNPVSGAVHAVVAPKNSSVVYIGAASGGIWRTDDI